MRKTTGEIFIILKLFGVRFDTVLFPWSSMCLLNLFLFSIWLRSHHIHFLDVYVEHFLEL